MRDKQTCKRCGTRKAEWLESEGGHRHARRPALDICPGCEAIETFEAGLDKERLPKGAQIVLIPNRR